MTLTSAHLAFTLLNLPQLFSPPATSSTLPTTSHLRSTHLSSFSHLKSSQLWPTLLTPCHRDAYTQSKLLHRKAFTHSKLLHTASFFTQQPFTQRSFYAKQTFAQRLSLKCDSRLSDAKCNSITHAAAATRKLDGAIPLRSADTDLQNTIEWQHTTVEHIP